MVLESLITPFKAENKPWEMMLFGFLYSLVSFLLAVAIFGQKYASLIAVFLTVLASVPLVYNTIRLEEKKDEADYDERIILREHSRAIAVFMFLFFGITLSFSVLFVLFSFFPGMLSFVSGQSFNTTQLFSPQLDTISSINGRATSTGFFFVIFLNNLNVLLFCILFSFVYGLGAIFILTWNASVIGVAIGSFVYNGLKAASSYAFSSKIAASTLVVLKGLFMYSIHGFFEVLAYFIAGLAGGIISVAVIKHSFGTKKFEKIVVDTADLFIISLVVLFIAALLEVFVTPLFFG